MNGLDFAHRKIVFTESSPITGRFAIANYRMLEKPLLSLSNIHTKRTIIYKASSALGTVFLQIALAYRLDQFTGNCYLIGSSKDDAEIWSKTRGKKWISSIPSIRDAMSADKYAMTNSLFQWPDKWLEINGPGETAQQARQCTYLFTDESHVDEYKEGSLAAFEERMSKRWNRHGLHTTTAADHGKEVDRYYYEGGQNEFHMRCKCGELVWPLWEDDAKEIYNGERVFHFKDSDTVKFICPHCSSEFQDESRQRFSLHENGDYVTKNPDHLPENESFRWNCFAAWWMPWAGHLVKYREAMEAAKLGNLQPMENFEKKRLCKSYIPKLPDFGGSKGANDYVLGDEWAAGGESVRILTVDNQAGKKDEGAHKWGLVTQWLRDGSSRRIAYERLTTWAHVREFQLQHDVLDKNVYVDAGHDSRTVFRECSRYHWFATRGSDDPWFIHRRRQSGKPDILWKMPYSQGEWQSGIIGTNNTTVKVSNGKMPPGWAIEIVISNPQVYGMIYALQNGSAGRYFGIARNMPDTYLGGFPAFMPVIEKNKKTNVDSVIWKKVKPFEHPWDCECLAVVGAIRAGFYPVAKTDEKTA